MTDIPDQFRDKYNLHNVLTWANCKNRLTQEMIEDLTTFLTSDHRPDLVEVSEKYKEEELFVLPKVPSDTAFPDCDVLIQTVGMREQPILLMIGLLKPRVVILLHTRGSKRTAEVVERSSNVKNRKIEVQLKEIDETSAISIYQRFEEILQSDWSRHNQLGDSPNIVIDPTSGRKAMVAATASAAFYFKLKMVYLLAYERMGIVMPFSELIRIIDNPYSHFGNFDIDHLQRMLNSYNYHQAIEFAENLEYIVFDPIASTYVLILKLMAKLYLQWDKFAHSDSGQNPYLSDRLEQIVKKIISSNCDFPPNVMERMERNILFLKKLEINWNSGSTNMVDYYRMVDLLQNAKRRKEMQRYDDAIARIYRLTEMITEYILELELNLPSPIKISQLGILLDESMLNKIRQKLDLDKDRHLGTYDKFNVISQLGGIYTKIADDYFKNDMIREIRNKSLLAHGTQPISQEDFESVFRMVHEWCGQIFPDHNFKIDFEQSIFPKF